MLWRIRGNGASDFLFNARRPEELVFGVAESSMREVIGRTPIQPALTQLRGQIEADVLHQTQEILDRYKRRASRSRRCSCRRSIRPPP